MLPELQQLLEHLEATVSLSRQADIDCLSARTLAWEPVERLPLSLAYPLPRDTRFRPFPHRQVFENPEKMLFNELVSAFDTSIAMHDQVGDDLPWTIRANFGIGIIASMFGARIEVVGDNPPWVHGYASMDEIRGVFDIDPADFSRGWCPGVIRRYEFYREALAPYPKLNQAIRVVMPDLQGPLDTSELLWGSSLYSDLVERPEMVDRFLSLLATAQIGFARRLAPLLSDGPAGMCHQHATALAGNILIRDDSAIMVSAAMYERQIARHDHRVLEELGGGGIHSCGNVSHIAPAYLNLRSIRSLDLGQSELNDIDSIYAAARQRHVALIRVDVPEKQLLSGEVLRRFPTGVVLHHRAASAQEAARIMAIYRDRRAA